MKNTQNNTHDWKVDSLNQDNLSKKKAIFLEDPQWLLRSLDFDFFRSHQRCSIKKAFLKISKKLQENTCTRASFFNKVEGWFLQLY